MTEAITVLRPTVGEGSDEHGTPNAGTPTSIPSNGWAVAPLTADEDSVATGQQLVEGYTLYKRELVDIRPDDRIQVRGEVFGVTSSANQWVNPFSQQTGTVVIVRRVG